MIDFVNDIYKIHYLLILIQLDQKIAIIDARPF